MIYEVSKHRLIYIFGIAVDTHRGLLKIGDTAIATAEKNLPPNCKALNQAALKRIKECTNTAGIAFKLLHTEIAVDNKNNSFRDYDVHRLLKNFKVKLAGTTGREWFRVDLATAIRAIQSVKQGKRFFISKKTFREEIILRPEQEDAISKTVDHFKADNKFLWNAKMRFGKTLCALEVVRQMNFAKTIIITHRPVVKDGWFKDFDKIFGGSDYICLTKDDDIAGVKNNFVYFASIQDLRGSQTVGGKHDKNSAVFKTQWDCVIVDEAHEGTKTPLGDAVIKKLVKKKTKFLALSGTPFNLIDEFSAVYTWDYVMEQRAKAAWDKNNFGDSNPYDELPQMNIFTYNLGEMLGKSFVDAEDISFSFKEFFRTDGDNFVHEDDVKSFLNLLVKPDKNNYPFSRPEYCEMFRHTLWIIPGVKEGRALSELLKNHVVFCNFEIVNVAGDGDSDSEPGDALEKVRDAIDNYDYTITLSCGKLTAGVTVPEWTAVFMLAGSYSTSATSYLQTIFRVQSPCNKYGVSKRNCYVFDFAPDRTLKVVAEFVKVSTRAGKTTNADRQHLGELLNFCPVIAVEGSEMKQLDATKLLHRIKRAQAERIARNGFDDNNLYNDTLRDLTNLDWEKFNDLKKIIGASKPTKKPKDIPVNEQGLTNELYDDDTPKTRKPQTPEEKENARRAAVKHNAILILRGLSIRMPLLIYGANVPVDDEFKIEMFLDPNIVDDASWAEFMPNGVTRDKFKDFIQYYDPENFINAGKIVRERAKVADDLKPTERVKKIAELFSTFKNPDKETVLTPYNVVKLHIDSAFDENFFIADKKILEINSKTGLYPLYVACKIYRARLGNRDEDKIPLDELRRLWDMTVAENIFVICKTPMAKAITRRTLIGYRAGNVNAHCFDDLINQLKNKPEQFLKRVTSKNFWNKGVGKMFFDAVVGNPPYQVVGSGDNKNFAAPIYQYFLDTAYNEKLTAKASLIHPARFLSNAGAIPGDFAEKFLQDKHVKVVKHFIKSQDVFPTSDIKGGVVITLYDANQTFEPIGLYIPFEELISIHQKVVLNNPNFKPFSDIIYSRTAYSLTPKAHEDNPDAIERFSKGNQYQMSSNVFDLMPEIFFDEKPDDGYEYIQLYGLANKQRIFKWVRRDYVTSHESLTKYKVFVPDSNGSGALGEVISTPLVGLPLVGLPLVGCTQTFITVGAFDSELEARACHAYIKSKFCRVMLGILKVTQHNPPATWFMVPMQDFTSASDIDWSVPIPDIDAQLYRKYGLDDAEIKFIESKVKAMT